MEKVSYSYTRENLSNILNQIINNSETYCIERKNGNQVVMIGKNDYDSLLETAYLLKSPNNARELYKAIDEANNDIGTKIEL